MKDIWLESALEDIKKAEKKLEIGDYKTVCILSRISATKSIYSIFSHEENFKYIDNLEILFERLRKLGDGFRELEEDITFLSRFILYEDIVTPYVVEKWLGLPTEEEARRALSIAKALYERFKSL